MRRYVLGGLAIGLAVPLLALVALSYTDISGRELGFVWPTAYFLLATDGAEPATDWLFCAIAISINMAFYAAAGTILGLGIRRRLWWPAMLFALLVLLVWRSLPR